VKPRPFVPQSRAAITFRSFMDDEGRWGARVELPGDVDGFTCGCRDEAAALKAAFESAGRNLAAFRALLVLMLCGPKAAGVKP
jgi:hypothetical protein